MILQEHSLPVHLKAYLEMITGEQISLIPSDAKRRLPLFLSGYQFFTGEIQLQKYVFAIDEQCRLSPMQYSVQRKQLENYLEAKVIFVFEVLSSTMRNRLFQAGIPFIVPGCQFFLPPGINFIERGKRKKEFTPVMPFAAQYIIIRELIFHDMAGIMQREIAMKTGYSPMSISLASDALAEKGLCKLISEKKSRFLQFNMNGRELWEKSLPLMRTPVRKVYWNMYSVSDLPWAGISALSQKSMLSPDKIPTFAINIYAFKTLPNFQAVDCKDIARSILEVWQYEPVKGNDFCVDPFSLYLSLKDEHDPRVESCLEEMMRSIKW